MRTVIDVHPLSTAASLNRIRFNITRRGRARTVDGSFSWAHVSRCPSDRGRGRVALQAPSGAYVSVCGTGKPGEVTLKSGKPGDAETFQWVDLQRGDTLLLSLATHRYIVAPPGPGPVAADHAGPVPDRKDGPRFQWRAVR